MPPVSRRQFIATASALPAGAWSATTGVDGRSQDATRGAEGRRNRQTGDGDGEPDPASAAALFNTGYSQEATVVFGDREYVLYRYENYITDNAGLEVFLGDDRLTAEERVRPVFQAESWQRAFGTLERGRFETVADIGETATAFNEPLTTLSTALETVLDLIVRVQRELGRELWRDVTDIFPEITEFRQTAQEAERAAEAWLGASEQLETALPELRDTSDRLSSAAERDFRGLESSFYGQFQTHLSTVRAALETLASVPERLVDAFEYLADRTRKIGNDFQSALSTLAVLDNVAGDGSVREPFDELATVVEDIPSPAQDFSGRVRPHYEHFRTVNSVASAHSRNRLEDWETRREADKKVRLLSGGATFLGFLVLAEYWSVPLDTDDDEE